MIPKRSIFNFLLCFAWLISIGACGNQDIISEHKVDIPKGGWNTSFVASIENISSEDAQKAITKVVHTSEYGFENLYLSVILTQDQDTIYNDLVNVSLMDNLGTWTGEKRGQNFEVSQLLSGITPAKGSISLYLKQHSREEVLQNIESIALVLSR